MRMENPPKRDPAPTGAKLRDLEGLVAEVAHARITRRQFVERVLCLGLSAGAVGGLLAACDGDSTPATALPTPSPMDTTRPDKIYLYNWPDYLTREIKRDFRRETGITIVEVFYDMGEDFLAKLKAGATGYDVLIPSDYMVSIMSRLKLIEPLDMTYLPAFNGVDQQFRNPVYDDPDTQDGQRYSAPYQWGTTGIAVRTDKIDSDSIDWWKDLWDPRYKGRIRMLNDERETMAVGLMKVGHEQTGEAWSINTTDQAQIDAATEALIEQKPLVRAYDSANMRRAIVAGRPLVHCWNGDALLAIDSMGGDARAEELVKFVYPQEGFATWVDAMVIPQGFQSRYGAHLFIDYMLRPEVQGKLSSYVWYLPVTPAATPFTDPLVYTCAPTAEEMERAQQFDDVGEFSRKYTEAWAQVKSA
jgi:spermidine/putrescine transport system substrate-binding protein